MSDSEAIIDLVSEPEGTDTLEPEVIDLELDVINLESDVIDLESD